MAYPKKLYLIVNTLEEENAARANGLQDGEPKQEYPKMLYLHPEDKTKDQKYITVNTPEEQDAAMAQGYKVEQHIPTKPAEEGFEGTPVSDPANLPTEEKHEE